MEKTNHSVQNQKDINYYAAIRKYLQKQYPKMDKTGVSALCREAVFAPGGYAVEIDGTDAPITAVRENLADFIERDNANKNFIPYSLDAEIADLIEKNNCETSSMNEYYRWISATADIVRHTGDGEVTESDASERSEFITMSYDRESEILLCLALYESAGREKNRGKIDMLRFSWPASAKCAASSATHRAWSTPKAMKKKKSCACITTIAQIYCRKKQITNQILT